MTAKKGSLVLIKISNGGDPETFSTIGGIRTSRMRINQQVLDASHIESGAWRQLLSSAGIRSVSISGSGVFTDAQSEETLREHAFSGAVGNYRFIFGNGDYLSGAFQITGYERNGDHDEEETYSITLESAGTITFTNV